jgi:spermidine/putrescine transport system substrate-binding protein
MPRRELLRRAAALGVGVVAVAVPGTGARAEEQAIYFTPGGYGIPELQTHYRAKHGDDPQWRRFADTDEALRKLQSGVQADVVHPCSDDLPRWIAAGVLQPIDVTRLRNWPDLHPRLRQLPHCSVDGACFFVPWEWGLTSITYRTDLIELPSGEESWGMLWDERNRGRVAVIDSAHDSWWCAAIYAGIPFDRIDAAAVDRVDDLLHRLRPNVGLITADSAAIAQALAAGEVVASISWADTARRLLKRGVAVKFARPKEGPLIWICGLVLARNAPHVDAAYDLIDGMLAPDIGAYCIRTFGYGHSNVKSFALVRQPDLAALGLADGPTPILAHGRIQPPVSQDLRARISQDWGLMRANP